MGFVNDLLGGGGANGGLSYRAQSAPLINPMTQQDANASYGDAKNGLAQQQAFLQALQAQGGLNNQAQIFNQYGQIAQGQGPNPAQAMLANATGQNVANQASLMAGQRGAGANAGLVARNAAMAGGNLQQQAAGQAAAMQAQQQLQALGQQSGIANQQVSNQMGATTGYNQALQSEQQNVLNAIAAQNNANVANQGNMNTANAGLANTQAGQQGSMFGGLMGGAGSALGGLFGKSSSAASVGTDAIPQSATDSAVSNGSSLITDSGKAMLYCGGTVPGYADGGMVSGAAQPQSFVGRYMNGFTAGMPGETVGVEQQQPQAQMAQANQKMNQAGNQIGGQLGGALKGALDLKKFYNLGEKTGINDYFSKLFSETGEAGKHAADTAAATDSADFAAAIAAAAPSALRYAGSYGEGLGAAGAQMTASGGAAAAGSGATTTALGTGAATVGEAAVAAYKGGEIPNFKKGGKVSGKPKIPGNSPVNDTVTAKVSPGEIVIPNAILQSDDPVGNAARFVAEHLRQSGRMK